MKRSVPVNEPAGVATPISTPEAAPIAPEAVVVEPKVSEPVAVAVAIAETVAIEPDATSEVMGDIDDAEIERRRIALNEVIEIMRPAVQMDGGDLSVVDVDYVAGVVEVQLEGACGSCAISSQTLQGGVDRLLRERLSWVTEVHGGVDDSMDPLESAAAGRGAYVPRYH